VSYVDTEKGFCFQNSVAENLFGNWCPTQSNQFIYRIFLPEFETQHLLYTNRLFSCLHEYMCVCVCLYLIYTFKVALCTQLHSLTIWRLTATIWVLPHS